MAADRQQVVDTANLDQKALNRGHTTVEALAGNSLDIGKQITRKHSWRQSRPAGADGAHR
jgi:hypothetical protein